MNYQEELKTLAERIEPINWKDPEDVQAKKTKTVIDFLKNINRHAWVKPRMNDFTYDYVARKVAPNQDNAIFNNLSTNKTSTKYFNKQGIDPTEAIIMVNVDFLIKHRGNVTSPRKLDSVRAMVKAGKKFSDVPQYELSTGKVEEGNHRVAMMKELGMKSVPVYIFKWE